MKILLLGKNGQLGWELQRSLAPLGELHACGREQADLEDRAALGALVARLQPDAIVNAAAYTAVDKAESEPDKAERINAVAAGELARHAAGIGAWLVHYSTDYVFDGSKTTPYREEDTPAPLSAYGRSKFAGEHLIRASGARHLIFRSSWVYAARGSNFARTMLRLAGERDSIQVVDDQHGAPTSAELIADVTALALYRIRHAQNADALAGTYHLAARGATSWNGYARYLLELAQAAGLKLRTGPEQVLRVGSDTYPTAARRPMNSRLDTGKLEAAFDLRLPNWRQHLQRLVTELAAQGTS